MRKVKQQQPTGKGEQLGILFHQARHIERELPRKPSETEGKNPPPPGAGKSQSDTGTAITLNLCIQAGVTLAWRWCDNAKTLPPPPKKKKKKKGKGEESTASTPALNYMGTLEMIVRFTKNYYRKTEPLLM